MPAHVVLLRQASATDPYEAALRGAGFDVRSVPVLAFEWVHEAALRRALRQPEAYGGLIATSPRAVEAVRGVWEDEHIEPTAWRRKPAFAVGPRTAEAFQSLGLRAGGADSGTAEALARRIIGETAPAKPLLFLCGNRRREVLPDLLRAGGMPFEELVVYRTVTRSALDAVLAPAPDWVVFFSPSGVAAVLRDLGGFGAGVRGAAIGPTTAAAARAAGLRIDAVAEAPSPEALVRALRGDA